MSIFDSFKANLYRSAIDDSQYYEVVSEEVQNGQIRPGLWAKAIAETSGDQEKAKALYLKLRVLELKAQILETKRIQENQQREREDEERERQRIEAENRANQEHQEEVRRAHELEVKERRLRKFKETRQALQFLSVIFAGPGAMLIGVFLGLDIYKTLILGLLGTVIGFGAVTIALNLLPKQRHYIQEAARIEQERERLGIKSSTEEGWIGLIIFIAVALSIYTKYFR